jgi:hypothetical protein
VQQPRNSRTVSEKRLQLLIYDVEKKLEPFRKETAVRLKDEAGETT